MSSTCCSTTTASSQRRPQTLEAGRARADAAGNRAKADAAGNRAKADEAENRARAAGAENRARAGAVVDDRVKAAKAANHNAVCVGVHVVCDAVTTLLPSSFPCAQSVLQVRDEAADAADAAAAQHPERS